MRAFKIFCLYAAIWLSSLTASAQIGWTLAQCRKHFGRELQWSNTWIFCDTSPGVVTFGINYRHYTPEENVTKRDAPAFSFDGVQVRVRFDSDGTVGKIQWERSGAFSNQVIQQLLKRSSAV